jgi:UTP--glucose-1-phosphate uridylyltransferase
LLLTVVVIDAWSSEGERMEDRAMSADAPRAHVTHAVFPVAGLGASFLPATKACPLELLPIVDRPLIQYAVDEAAAAGITNLILVTARTKRAIEDHFDRAYELEHELVAHECHDALRALHATIPRGVSFTYVRQREATGVAGALARARPLLRESPFAVIVPDQLIDASRPAIAQVLDVFDEHRERAGLPQGRTGSEARSANGRPSSVVGVERGTYDANAERTMIAADLEASAIDAARTLVKVPPIGAASMAVSPCGRAVFTPAIFDALDARGSLAAAIRRLMDRERVLACVIDGERFDCATKLGFLEAQFAFAAKRQELWRPLRERLTARLGNPVSTHRERAHTGDTTAAIMR